MMKTATYSSPSNRYLNTVHGLTLSRAFMLFLFLSISLLGLSLGAIMVFKVDTLIKENRQNFINQEMLGVSKSLSNYITLRNSVLKDYAAFPILLQGVMHPNSSGANAHDFIQDLSILGDKVPLHLLDLEGELLFSTNPHSECLHYQGALQRLLAKKDAQVLLDFCIDADGKTQSWVLLAPILYHDEGEGYLSIEIPSQNIINDLALSQHSQRHHIEIIKKDKILLSLGTPLELKPKSIEIPELSITLHYRTNEEDLYQARKTVINNLLASLVVIFLIISLLSQKLGYIYFIRPFEQLRNLTKELENGEEVHFSNKNAQIKEIHDLEDSFQHMALKIKNREETINAANASLKSLNNQIIQQQELLVHSEKLASVGQLAAGVAHEINNPTGYVQNNLGVLNTYSNKIKTLLSHYHQLEKHIQETSEANAYLNTIRDLKEDSDIDYILKDMSDLIEESIDGTKRIKDIVMDLKSFSRVDNQTLQTVDINKEVIEVALRLVSSEIKYKCIIKKELAELPLLDCRPGEISQVIMNLIVNACDALDDKNDNGDITLTSYAEHNDIFIKIKDTGTGIKESDRLKIFDPFYTTKEVGKGTGLGLSICQAIIKKHDGEITVDTALGKGTTFTIRLPL